MITKEQKDAWLKALRSGDYEQGKLGLCNDLGQYCCLGVACEVLGLGFDKLHTTLKGFHPTKERPFQTDYWFGEATISQMDILQHAAKLNDDGKDFDEIADYLERNLHTEL